jgi:capsular exopolysaccharide synthesis family protein
LKDLDREIAISTMNVQQLETTKLREETLILTTNKPGTLNIVSEAHASPLVSGVASQRPKLMVYGMILALIFGVALVIGMDALDNSIRTGEDVEKLTGLPVAGIIPEHFPDPIRSPRMALLEPMSAAAEAYRLLRTDLLFTSVDHPFQSLLPATAKPGQGATTTICNLAIVLAQSGRRVILVDADLRQPKLNRIFDKEPNEPGLVGVLEGSCTLDEAILPTGVENLALLPAGAFVTNPSEILGSPRMQALHEQLKGMADFVLFDAPSAIAYSDTAILSSFVDATLMIVRANSVPRGTEDQVRALLNKARANVIGAVLNGVTPEEVDSVHFHSGAIAALPAAPTNGSRGNGTGGGGPRIIPIAAPVGPAFTAPVGTAVRRDAIDEDDEVAIPLPGAVSDTETTAASLGAPPPPAPAIAGSVVPVTQSMADANSFYGNGADSTDTERRRIGSGSVARAPGRPRNPIPIRLVAFVAVAGTIMGLLVLLLGGGANVK